MKKERFTLPPDFYKKAGLDPHGLNRFDFFRKDVEKARELAEAQERKESEGV